MRAVVHGWKPPGGGAPSKKVATEFMHADEDAKKGSRNRRQREERKQKTDEWALRRSRSTGSDR